MNRISYLIAHIPKIYFILALALVLRLILINQSFWLDEAAQALESVRPLSQQLNLKTDFQPPLYSLVVHFFSLVSHADWWLRLASVIPGLIVVYLTYQLGCLVSNRRVGLIAALFLATSQLHIFYSQELRPYSFATLWAVLSIYYFLKLLKDSRYAKYYILYTILGLYSVYTFVFLILAQLVYFIIFHRQSLKLFIGPWILVILLFMPWLPKFLEQLHSGLGLTVSVPLWRTAVSPPFIKALLLIPPKFVFGRLVLPTHLLAYIPLICFLIFIAYLIWSVRRQPHFWFLLIWLLVPLLAGFFVSIKIPLLDPKRFLFCLPPLYLLLSGAKTKLKYSLLVVNLVCLCFYWFTPANLREPWKQAVAVVSANLTPTTALIFPWNGPYAPWTWYAAGKPKMVSFKPLPVTTQEVNAAFASMTQTDHLIYFDYLENIADPHALIKAGLTTRGWIQDGFFQYPGIGQIRLYSRAPHYALQ